eukprot:13184123-Ditylum_brightwellii.AAC.1
MFSNAACDAISNGPSKESLNPSRIARVGEDHCFNTRFLPADKACHMVLMVYHGFFPPPSTNDCLDNGQQL